MLHYLLSSSFFYILLSHCTKYILVLKRKETLIEKSPEEGIVRKTVTSMTKHSRTFLSAP